MACVEESAEVDSPGRDKTFLIIGIFFLSKSLLTPFEFFYVFRARGAE